jgi:hypothetical protein
MASLLNVLMADRVKALLEAPDLAGFADEERSMSKETATLIIHAVLWAYGARGGSFASCYAYDGLAEALKPVRNTLEGLWKMQDQLAAQSD